MLVSQNTEEKFMYGKTKNSRSNKEVVWDKISGNWHFCCSGYYVDTVGKNAKKTEEYIRNQLNEDMLYDQMSMKEYIDPFTGEPVIKSNKKK